MKNKKNSKKFIDAMKQGMEPMIEALSQDNLKEEEQLLFCYFSKYYPLESDKRISKVTIENGFLKPVILIETRDLNGMSSIIREPYKRNITKAKKRKEASDQFLFQMTVKLSTYSQKGVELLEQVQARGNSQERSQILEVLTKLQEIAQSVRKYAEGLLSEKEQQVLERLEKDFEAFAIEKGYASMIQIEKYQIPALNDLRKKIEKKEEKNEQGEVSINDIQYVESAIKYLSEQEEETYSKTKYTSFVKLSISDRLKLAYNQYALGLLRDCKLSLVRQTPYSNENLKMYFQENKQRQVRELINVQTKITSKGEVTKEEMLSYLYSLNGYQKEDIGEKVVREAPWVLEDLEYLKEKFPNETLVDKKLASYQRYFHFAIKVQKNRLEAMRDLKAFLGNLFFEQEQEAKSYLEKGTEVKDTFYLEENHFLETCIGYLEDRKDKDKEEEERVSSDILSLKSQFDKLNLALNISQNLKVGMTDSIRKDVYEMSKLIEYYIKGSEIKKEEQDQEITGQVIDRITSQCQALEAWDKPLMQEIKKDIAPVPKEKLLQRGLYVS